MTARIIIDGYHLSRSERIFLASCVMEFLARRTDIGELGLDVEVVREAAEAMALRTNVTPLDAVKLITPIMRELAQLTTDELEGEAGQ